MSEIPDVPDDVARAERVAPLAELLSEHLPALTWETYLDAAEAVSAYLRAHPEDAAAVLDGELWDDTALDRLTLTVRWPLPEEADRG